MHDELTKQAFMEAAQAWVCDGYAVNTRFVAAKSNENMELWDASIVLSPLPSPDLPFCIEAEDFIVGHAQSDVQNKSSLLRLVSEATSGTLELHNKRLELPDGSQLNLYSEMERRDRTISELDLQIGGARISLPSQTATTRIDNTLRLAQPPFDGMSDVAEWLELRDLGASAEHSRITIRVLPPVELSSNCVLGDDRLQLTLHAHPELDLKLVNLSVRATPGRGLSARRKIAEGIMWRAIENGWRVGTVQIQLECADSALVMLMVGASVACRQWYFDPAKSRNYHLLSLQHFDKDLTKLREAALGLDAKRFEKGVAALLFLLGFSAVMPLETDSPDVIAVTPKGKLAVIECTTRIADFSTKVGKLVDRRGALSKSLAASGTPQFVFAVLICQLPRDQIAALRDDLRTHNTILLSREDIIAAFERVRLPHDPDRYLDTAQARISSAFSYFGE